MPLTTSWLGSLSFAFIALGLFQCSINSYVFYAWITQALIPIPPPITVVVMDNASFYKRSGILAALQKTDAMMKFLPPYSPELNPIEYKWA